MSRWYLLKFSPRAGCDTRSFQAEYYFFESIVFNFEYAGGISCFNIRQQAKTKMFSDMLQE